MHIYSCDKFEMDHCYAYVSDLGADRLAYMAGGSSGWDNILIHNNEFYVPSTDGNYGCDFLQITGTGWSIYSNLFRAYYGPGGVNHQDGVQWLGGCSNFKVYANTFVNNCNSVIDVGDMFGNNNNVFLYNNLIVHDNYSGSPGGGFWVEEEFDGYVNQNYWAVNNTFVNFDSLYGFVNFDTEGGAAGYVDCGIADNLAVNAPSIGSGNGKTFSSYSATYNAYNSLVNSNYTTYFVGWAPSGIPNMRLTSAGNSALRVGVNLYTIPALSNYMSFLALDADGKPRPTSGPWTVGAYEYGGTSTNPVISVKSGQVSSNFMIGTTNTITLQVQNAGSGTLAGSATVIGAAGVYSITSGQSYSLTSGQSQVVMLRYVPATTNDWTIIRFTGGGGVDVAITNHAQLPLGLSFAATSGTITAPFTVAGSYVSQSAETGVANGGQAVYPFTITNVGSYTVSASVNAPSAGENSFYVNIDAEPTDPAMIWDIPISTGFTNQTVSWRGTGTDTNAQYVPAVFNLSTGTHQLIIVGREADVQLAQITISPYLGNRPTPPSSPPNLRVIALSP
jgi:hypothetical protein